ncbi:hypothetical protein [Catalinimonas niigatensis]|uniref:hypothetical protein n=1 Tax=Catalinimonas niigatensis TaxID=1397264 RepID=UPI0026658986|nr:hypothetical protein [Catalinimonas niigatensis]WPP51755.1 hypothetical protein PZB72_05065 [Catalinimonas niigatensis]
MQKYLGILFCLCMTLSAYSLGFFSAIEATNAQRKLGLSATRYRINFSSSFPLYFHYQPFDTIPKAGLYQKGRQDARLFYKQKGGTFWVPFGVTMTTIFIPYTFFVPGIATGALMGFTKPQTDNLKTRDIRYADPEMLSSVDELFKDSLYAEGYRKGAQQRNLREAATGVGVGVGTTLVLFITLFILFTKPF